MCQGSCSVRFGPPSYRRSCVSRQAIGAALRTFRDKPKHISAKLPTAAYSIVRLVTFTHDADTAQFHFTTDTSAPQSIVCRTVDQKACRNDERRSSRLRQRTCFSRLAWLPSTVLSEAKTTLKCSHICSSASVPPHNLPAIITSQKARFFRDKGWTDNLAKNDVLL